MRFLKGISVRYQQTLIIMLTSGVALLLACTAFIAYDVVNFRRTLIRDAAILAEVVGNNCAVAIDSRDFASATGCLRALQAKESVVSAAVYARDGARLAMYQRDHAAPPPLNAGSLGHEFTEDQSRLFRSIERHGEKIGTIFVASDLNTLFPQLSRYTKIVGAILLASLIIALALSTYLQRLISAPILHLAQLTRKVATEKDYSVRATMRSNGELGQLVDGFNEMLDQIQARDHALTNAQNELEKRVAERTAALEETQEAAARDHARFKFIFKATPVGISWVVPGKTSLLVNPAHERLSGVSAEDAQAPDAFARVTHPDDRAIQMELTRKRDAGETDGYSLEKRYLHSDGSVVWVLFTQRLYEDPATGEKQQITTLVDITQRKEAEARLQRTEELYRRAIGGAGAVPYSLDYRTRSYLFLGEGIEDLIGYRPGEVNGEVWTNIIQQSEMLGEAAGMEKDAAHKQTAEGEIQTWRCDMRVLTRNGGERWIADVSVQQTDESGRVIGSMGILQDITERKTAEAKLQRTEELYRRAIGGAGAVPYSLDYRTKSYVFLGEGIEDLIGYRSEELDGKVWKSIIQEADMLGETAGVDKTVAQKQAAEGEIRTWRCDMRVLTRDGKSCWISDVSVQQTDVSGQVIGAMGILQDITDRKQAEIAASIFSTLGQDLASSSSAEEAARVIGQVADKLLGWDAYGVSLYSEENDIEHGILNIDLVNGKRVGCAVAPPRKPTKVARGVLEKGARLILRNAPDGALPDAIPFGDKSRPAASLLYVPIRHGSRRLGVLTIQSYTPNAYTDADLTTLQELADRCAGAMERVWAEEALRESESQFRLIWESSADGMRLADLEGVVEAVNPAYCKMVGKTEAELQGRSIAAIQPEELGDVIVREHRARMTSETMRARREVEITLWNGDHAWFEVSDSRLQLPDKPLLLLTIFRDITDRKEAEAKLAALHNQLLDTSRQAGMAEIASNVLHNVGNVLNSVNVSANLVGDGVRHSRVSSLPKVVSLLRDNENDLGTFIVSERGRQLLAYLGQLSAHLESERETITQEVESLRANVEHIKEIVAMQQNYARVSGAREVVNVVDLVEDSLRLNAGSLSRHNVEVIRKFHETASVNVEKHKILQILINLVRNAKYACDEQNPPHKLITVTTARNGGECIRISVADNGIGIPRENLTRIFNHGFTTRKKGHGFGLHSSALAAREIGGSLTVQSDGPGRGATFILDFPCGVPAVQTPPKSNTEGKKPAKKTKAQPAGPAPVEPAANDPIS